MIHSKREAATLEVDNGETMKSTTTTTTSALSIIDVILSMKKYHRGILNLFSVTVLVSLCLMMQAISVVESFTVPSTIINTRITNAILDKLHLSQTDIYEKDGGSSATDNDDNNNYWKSISRYVFDTSVDTTNSGEANDTSNEDNDNNDNNKDQQKMHPHSKPIVLFDGVCNLCNDAANFVIDHDETGKFRFASLQSNVAKSLLLREGQDPIATADIVLVTPTTAYYSSEAVSNILAELDLPKLQVVGMIGQKTPAFLRETVYKVVSRNRFVFGKKDSCRLDFDGDFTSRFVSDPPVSKTN
ncbi:MAG: putative DCC family thiol-disulfide oxidoreductase YuxK [Bacillariaceae sp.]|jgi:predicted DCC family thiol-disulfide oxidoreductase YuxK